MEKYKLEQVCEDTGISEDYLNEYHNFAISYFGRHFGTRMKIKFPKKGKIRKYEERYSLRIYDYDTKNPRIALLNKIADEVNLMAKKNKLTYKKFCDISDAVEDVIRLGV